MSQNTQILKHLEKHGRIDPITALKEYGCFRLAARIKDLRDRGNDITTQKVKHKNGNFYAVYKL